MKNTPRLFKILQNWKHLSGYSGKKTINNTLALPIKTPNVVEYSMKVDSKYGLKDKSILFFADLHFQENSDSSYFPKLIQETQPDYIVFGGDLITYACCIKDAFLWLNKNFADFADIPKFAVPGNWDRRRQIWFPLKIWYEKYREAGFELLVNETRKLDGIQFYGVDDPRRGKPILKKNSFDPESYNLILSHSIEPVVDVATENEIPGESLALCGHSHAGQLRIPYLGAVFTSTKYWKLFEYGLYENKHTNVNMIMTSGLGTSRLPFRLFCDPEVVIVKFADK